MRWSEGNGSQREKMKRIIRNIFRAIAPVVIKVFGPTRVRKIRELIGIGKIHDEVRIVACALAKDRGKKGIMIDVGAHRGESFLEFADNGWTIYCFEPNPANHVHIEKWQKILRGNINLFGLAVSDTSKKRVWFYLSHDSSGISSLHAFHKSHQYGFTVDTITLESHCAEHKISHVDFLKIDAEGHDFFVLKGINWEQLCPDIILCEFEDNKTRPLGYTYENMADYLIERGYKVIVSEWFPIDRYGADHKWRSFMNYPCQLQDQNGWGNLIAVRNAADLRAIISEIEKITL
jgi:FkbM family methyltransferase